MDAAAVMNATQQVLKNARDVIESGWCRGAYAKNKYGDSCDPQAGAAVEFCMDGALQRVFDAAEYEAHHKAVILVVDTLRSRFGSGVITQFNDKIAKNKDDVLKLFDNAIAAAA